MAHVKLISYAEILTYPGLLAEYAAECSIPEIGPINPQPQIYAQMEAAGIARCFGVFHAESLIGFACLLTTVYPHYGVKVATLESLFVSNQFRGSNAGTKLMQAVEAYAKEAGCKAILYSAPAKGKLERLLSKRKMGRKTNSVFCFPL